MKKDAPSQATAHAAPSPDPAVNEMTAREVNAVHYMSGYVTSKFIKRYQKKSPNKLVQKKRHMFVSVLQDMVISRVAIDARIQWSGQN